VGCTEDAAGPDQLCNPCLGLYGKQLSSSAKIMELFEHLKVTGRCVAIPEVTWDAEGHGRDETCTALLFHKF
jgi:hypothetical protein